MSREIKFQYGFQSVNGIIKKVYHLHEIPNIKEKCDVFNVLPIVYVREFTGLRDKNGKEIYEGDVYITEQGVKYKIMFINGCFVGGKNENNNAPLSWCLADYKKEIIRDDFHEEIEIIGNIYENPELL